MLASSDVVVPVAGLEPARLAALDFESSTSTNSITPARFGDQQRIEPTQLTASPYAIENKSRHCAHLSNESPQKQHDFATFTHDPT